MKMHAFFQLIFEILSDILNFCLVILRSEIIITQENAMNGNCNTRFPIKCCVPTKKVKAKKNQAVGMNNIVLAEVFILR